MAEPLLSACKVQFQILDSMVRLQLLNTMVGPRLLNTMVKTQLLNTMVGTQLLNNMVRPQLLNTMVGTQLLNNMVRPQLLNTMVGTQLLNMVGTQLNLSSKSSKFSTYLHRAWCHLHSSPIFCLWFIMTIVIVLSFALERNCTQCYASEPLPEYFKAQPNRMIKYNKCKMIKIKRKSFINYITNVLKDSYATTGVCSWWLSTSPVNIEKGWVDEGFWNIGKTHTHTHTHTNTHTHTHRCNRGCPRGIIV